MARKCFFDLPPEIRERVYSALYSSITLTYPHFGSPLLATVSKRVRDDSVLAYYHNIQLKFPSPRALVDYLTSIDSATLRELRHISVRGYIFPVSQTFQVDMCTYGLCFVLMLFPGLKLSTLEVREFCHEPGRISARWDPVASYGCVERLLECDGFKKLIYVSTNDRFLKIGQAKRHSVTSNSGFGPDPQPGAWSKMIQARDGAESGAEARLYRLTKKGSAESKVEFETPEGFGRGETAPFYLPAFYVRAPHESVEVQVEVHVMRGRGIDYTQTGKCTVVPDLERPLMIFCGRMVPGEIQYLKKCHDLEN